jgi:hypothetical protein
MVTARENKPYLMRVTADYADGSEDIRVTLSLARAGVLRRAVTRQTFVITKENTFRV